MDAVKVLAAAAFPFLIGLAVWYLAAKDRERGTPFKLIQFVTDTAGRGNSGSLAYVTALLVSTWLIYYAALADRMSAELLIAYTGAFVLGQVARSGIDAVRHHTRTKKAEEEPATPEPPHTPSSGTP